MPEDLLGRFLAFWNEMRGIGELPYRKKLDVTLIPNLLPYLVLLESRDGGSDFYHVIVGETVADNYGRRLSKTLLSEVIKGNPTVAPLADNLRTCMSTRQPVRVEDEFVTAKGIQKRFCGVISPLTEDGSSVSAFLCCFVHLQKKGTVWVGSPRL
ncbi:PAS domain-containing protein [Arenibaculum pallidiluteum]|uniref:PAS domain-containing protein n=1 Tax=Arenibaculum pallidiluteum TaxID=2812559 RepID=UPI001A96F063|nr:PAS domain-containing protein [Arenibaculum pallidiluteum]